MTQWNPTWSVVHTAQGTAEEPAEGGEDAYNEQEWQGEAQTIEYDDDYPRMPRIELDYPNVVAASITVTLKDAGSEFDLTDYTTDGAEKLWYKNWAIPITTNAYLHRCEGDECNVTRIYFNPALDGEEVDVVYSYYLTDAPICDPVIFRGGLYLNETGERHRFLKLVGSTFDNTYSPRWGDTGLNCITVGTDRIWAVSSPSQLLCQYYTEWTGYVGEVNSLNAPIWGIVAALARAGNEYCYDYADNLYIVRRDTASPVGTFPNILTVTKKTLHPYKKVKLSYGTGRVSVGTGKPVLNLSCNYVYDKGHAEILCQEAYDFYNSKKRIYYIECAGIIEQIQPCDEKYFEYEGEVAAGIVIGRELNYKGTTVFAVIEKTLAAQGEGV